MLPVFCLGEQFPASVRMKRGTLPTERAIARKRCAVSIPASHVFPTLFFVFALESL